MEPYAGDDIYCDQIIPGELPVTIVTETDAVLAFHHTRPRWSVHLVVVPKAHIPSLIEVDQSSAFELLRVLKEVAGTVAAETGGCRVVTNLGGYQDSKHLHFHIYSGPPLNTY